MFQVANVINEVEQKEANKELINWDRYKGSSATVSLSMAPPEAVKIDNCQSNKKLTLKISYLRPGAHHILPQGDFP